MKTLRFRGKSGINKMISWSQSRLHKPRVTIAVLLALLLLTVPVATASASPLSISQVSAENVLNTLATITWTTDVPATSIVNYGNTTDLGLSAYDDTMVTSHSVTLRGLQQSTVYFYEVQSTDADNNTLSDNNGGAYYTFTTTDFMAALTKPIGGLILFTLSVTSNVLDDFVNLSATEPITAKGSNLIDNLSKIVTGFVKTIAQILKFLH
jgi:hypothetical protein